MKVIIAGSRVFNHDEPVYYRELEGLVKRFEESYGEITMVVCGMARGPDKIGLEFAKRNEIAVAKFPANWDLHRKAAGPIRNQKMGEFADAAIIMWDGESTGSKHMMDVMRKLKKPFLVDICEQVVYDYVHHPSGLITRKYPTPSDIKP